MGMMVVVSRRIPLMALLAVISLLSVRDPVARADVWACTQPDGSLIYSDRVLGQNCRLLEELPKLQRVPSEPFTRREEQSEDKAPESRPAPAPGPMPGGGRRIDPPLDSVIWIGAVNAIPNFNSLLGIAHYRATMELENRDSEWTAEKVCIDVRFRDRSHIFLDVEQVGCLEDLRPFTPRTFTVTYTGLIPPRLFPIEAEAKVDFVKWTK